MVCTIPTGVDAHRLNNLQLGTSATRVRWASSIEQIQPARPSFVPGFRPLNRSVTPPSPTVTGITRGRRRNRRLGGA